MIYKIYDTNGFVGKFLNVQEFELFRKLIMKYGGVSIKEFVKVGSSLLTESLYSDVYAIIGSNVVLDRYVEKLIGIMDKADTVIILGE